MATTVRRRTPVDSETEESRAFYQARLGLFAGWVCLFSAGFYLVGTLLRLIAQATQPTLLFIWSPLLFHLAGTLVAGGVCCCAGGRH